LDTHGVSGLNVSCVLGKAMQICDLVLLAQMVFILLTLCVVFF